MREIKVRMWSNKAKKYFYGYGAHECLTQQVVFDNKESDRLGHDHVSDGMVFEQLAGVKDKNGKEIYELMELNNRYIVIYVLTGYFVYDIVYDILKPILEAFYENGLEITREHSPVSENQKRNIDEHISSSEIKIYC